ncbi:MAG: hypothetical protein OER77_09085 [Myxococcales bacterium]|nr:hypothetical protein [Myxococcales bacterium]
MRSSDSRVRSATPASTPERTNSPGKRAVDRDPRLRGRLLRQFDRGVPRASLAAVIAHGVVGWAACGALMGALLATMSEQSAIIGHAVGAPIIFAVVTAHLFLRSGGRRPIFVASTFTAIVIALDALIVAWLIQGSFAMFSSALGTWVPFALNFVSVFVTGSLLWRGRKARRA